MKRVCFIITKSEVGGAQTWVKEISHIISKEAEIYLVTSEVGWLTQTGVFKESLILPGIKSLYGLTTLFKLILWTRKNKIDILVASSANAGVYARLAKLFINYKCIYVSHGWSCLYNGGRAKKFFCSIEKFLSKLTDVIWCISVGDAIKAENIIGIENKKIVTLVNAVPKMPQKKIGELENKILFVGRLTHPKRPDLLARVISKRPSWSLDVVGGGEQLEILRDGFKKFNNIRFLGEISDFSNYNNYDLFALISDSEGLPMSGLEAHTAALPLLMSNVGGCPELIDNNGILVENSEEEIEKAIVRIFDEYDFYITQSAKDCEKFTIERHSEDYKKLILE